MEAEAWLMDENALPAPANKAFLKACADPMVVEEIAQFNFELNTEPLDSSGPCFKQLIQQLGQTWEKCQSAAAKLKLRPLFVGIHPMVRDEMLQQEFISDGQRYEALNNEVLNLRGQKPLTIDIQGADHFHKTLDHILIEAACTSIQVHIQANQENFRRLYNASLLASIPSVAVAANSPFLYGHDLWAETRIPLFEQSVRLNQFRDKKGRDVGRVTYGTGYVQHSPLELFLENLDGYSPMVPVLFDDEPEVMHHLRFHNGTLWRWVRPIVGVNSKGQAHLRIEQRSMASGPSLLDMVANTAFSVGLTYYFANQEKAPEESMTFTDSYNNFYQAAKDGLAAKVRWFGKTRRLDTVIYEDLIPAAKQGLRESGIDDSDITFFIDEIIQPRVLSGQTGARWQRAFVATHGLDFQALTEAYWQNQNSGKTVNQWQV
jgi:gamma-glutamylcysteine synthetase